MYFFDNVRRKLPHIYTKYQGADAVFSMSDVSLLSGDLPVSRTRLIQTWIEIYRDTLLADWVLAVKGEALFQIDPLR